MRVSEQTYQESIRANLDQWCFEVDSEFAQANADAAYEMTAILKLAQRPLSVVELGCGDGAALNVFNELKVKTHGVDINTEKLVRVKSKTTHADMMQFLLSQSSGKLANVFMHHSLEHVPNPEQILVEIARTMRTGAIFYCVVPADDHPHEVHFSAFDAADELLPPGFTPILLKKQIRYGHPEYLCVAKK